MKEDQKSIFTMAPAALAMVSKLAATIDDQTYDLQDVARLGRIHYLRNHKT